MANLDQTLSLSGDLLELHKNNAKLPNKKNRDKNESLLDLLDQVNETSTKKPTHPCRKLKIVTSVSEAVKMSHPSKDEYFPSSNLENKPEVKQVFMYAAQYGLKSSDHLNPPNNNRKEINAMPLSVRFPPSSKETVNQKFYTLPRIDSKLLPMQREVTPRPNRAYLQPMSIEFENQHPQFSTPRNPEKLFYPTLQLPDEKIQSPLSAKFKPNLKEINTFSHPNPESGTNKIYVRSLKKIKSEIYPAQKSVDMREYQSLHRVQSQDYENSPNMFTGPYHYSGMYKNGQASDPLSGFMPVSSSLLLKQIFSPNKDSTSSSEQDLQSPYQERFQKEEKEKLKFRKIESIVSYRARLE